MIKILALAGGIIGATIAFAADDSIVFDNADYMAQSTSLRDPAVIFPPTCCGLSMVPSAWNIRFSPNMPLNPAPNNSAIGPGVVFSFPVGVDGVHYFTNSQVPHSLVKGLLTQIAVNAPPGSNPGFVPVADPCTPPPPAAVRLYIEQIGAQFTNVTPGSPGEYQRWWSVANAGFDSHLPFYDLAVDGNVLLGVSVKHPEFWTDVFGKGGTSSPQAAAGFATAIANVGALGVTFGGCGFGHGVFATSPAVFYMNGFWAQ